MVHEGFVLGLPICCVFGFGSEVYHGSPLFRGRLGAVTSGAGSSGNGVFQKLAPPRGGDGFFKNSAKELGMLFAFTQICRQ